MSEYAKWNKALVDYFTGGIPQGAPIYLSVDDQAILEISRRLYSTEIGIDQAVQYFLNAIRSECISGDKVTLKKVSLWEKGSVPNCVGFLGAMVFAAYQMAEESVDSGVEVSEINYFTRLRSVLGLSTEMHGRPNGLNGPNVGLEEGLWQNWNSWLYSNGWFSSAEPGEEGVFRFIGYSLSQALLRKGDKNRILKLLKQEEKNKQIGRVWDQERLAFWLKESVRQFNTKHIRGIIVDDDHQRFEAFAAAVYDLYTAIDWDNEDEQESYGDNLKRITAGLYRLAKPIQGTIDYLLYPKQPRRWQNQPLSIVNHDGQKCRLRQERNGWFEPLWSVNPGESAIYKVDGNDQIKEVIFPQKSFWILIQDPDNEGSGSFASWGNPCLGDTFLLLCRDEYVEQINTLCQENLITWEHQFDIEINGERWHEYRECMVVSQNWGTIIPIKKDLYDALRPTTSATISLKEGVRLANPRAWMIGCEPIVTIIGFVNMVSVEVVRITQPAEIVFDQECESNKPFRLPALKPGDYLIQIKNGTRMLARQTLRLLSWDSLICAPIHNEFQYSIERHILPGSRIVNPQCECKEEKA